MTQWGNVGFIGLSSGVGYFCWLWALSRLDASRVVGFQALGPVTAAVIEVVVTRQWPSSALVVAVALVVSGLFVSQRCNPKRSRED
jgi:drug/metabolite transporter (DMT)-like permease